MIELYEDVWKKMKGAKQTPYDVSAPLKRLERENKPATIAKIYDELWANLVHDDMIGTASLMAVPHLVRIARANKILDINLLKLCCTIHLLNGKKIRIKLPYGYHDYDGVYNSGIKDLGEYVTENIEKVGNIRMMDPETITQDSFKEADDLFRYALATIAVARDNYWVARTLMIMDTEKQVAYVEAIDAQGPQTDWHDIIEDNCEYLGY
ncbi:MAG: hypothetical protein JWQ38_1332 [Flavipsychrobacter sp.]|nr:hypothetical protein [Flavipsychrobacter sp.]